MAPRRTTHVIALDTKTSFAAAPAVRFFCLAPLTGGLVSFRDSLEFQRNGSRCSVGQMEDSFRMKSIGFPGQESSKGAGKSEDRLIFHPSRLVSILGEVILFSSPQPLNSGG
jgi:hypothetical protein